MKLNLDDVRNIYGNSVGAETTLNTNFTRIESALENTLSRDGTTPNAMTAPLDMNSNRVINVSDGVSPSDAVNLRQLQATLAPDTALDDLSDVSITSPVAGDRLVYSGTSWTNAAPTEGEGTAIADLADVDITAPENQQALVYDGTSGQWVNLPLPSGVTDHGALTGKSDDDHPQYLTQARGASYFASLNLTVTGINSVTGGGNLTANRTLQLVGDISAPGGSRYYGTNAAGTKGWYNLPSPSSDHGTLVGLSDDDHPQYLNNARGDLRFASVGHAHPTYAEKAANETITGAWTYSSPPEVASAGPVLYHASDSYVSSKVTVSTGAPSGGANGDIWLVYQA